MSCCDIWGGVGRLIGGGVLFFFLGFLLGLDLSIGG